MVLLEQYTSGFLRQKDYYWQWMI